VQRRGQHAPVVRGKALGLHEQHELLARAGGLIAVELNPRTRDAFEGGARLDLGSQLRLLQL
jgi:hypothetical protein